MRRALALAALLVLAAPAAAGAHATLEGASPERGATVARAPGEVALRFDEPVEGAFGAVRVFDAHGERVDRGDVVRPGGEGDRLAVRLRRGLAEGTYTATYRVVSADGHVVSGGFVFSVGRATAAGETVEELLGDAKAGPVTGVAFGAARAAQYAALALAGGTVAFLLLVWPGAPPAALLRRGRAILLAAAVAGAASALAAVVLQAAQAAGVTGWSALRPDVVREVLGTRFGAFWSLAALAWALVAALAARTPPERGGGPALRLAAAPLANQIAVPALSGHATTQSPVAVLLPANVAHVAAMAAWLGGLACLLVAVPAVTRAQPAPERARTLAAVLPRFSALALGAVAVLAVAGLVQAYVEVRHPGLLLDTAFGRAVLVKLALLAALVGLGALNRRRTVPRLVAAARAGRPPGEAGATLRATLRAEAVLVAAALAVTGALAGYPPATAEGGGPFSATTRVGPQALQLTVDPARVGANQVHLYLTDPRTGAAVDDAEEVTIRATLPSRDVGPLSEDARRAGPGHYVVNGLALGVAGTWTIGVAVRVGDFDRHERDLEVRVR